MTTRLHKIPGKNVWRGIEFVELQKVIELEKNLAVSINCGYIIIDIMTRM